MYLRVLDSAFILLLRQHVYNRLKGGSLACVSDTSCSN